MQGNTVKCINYLFEYLKRLFYHDKYKKRNEFSIASLKNFRNFVSWYILFNTSLLCLIYRFEIPELDIAGDSWDLDVDVNGKMLVEELEVDAKSGVRTDFLFTRERILEIVKWKNLRQ